VSDAIPVTRRSGIAGEPQRAPRAIGRNPPTALDHALTVAAAGVWTAVVAMLAVWRHHQFVSHRLDLGNMVQAVWGTTQGSPLEQTDAVTGEQVVRMGAHVDPILVLLAPLWLVFPGPETLIVAQAAALALGVFPVVRLSLKYVHSRVAALLLGAWYLVFPWLVWNAFDEVHPVTFAIPLLLYAIWFLDEHRFVPFAVFAALAMSTGELMGLAIAGLGVWYALRHRRVRAGLAIAVAGVTWTTICIAAIMPAFTDGPPRHNFLFESVGGSPAGLLRTVVTDPGSIVAQVTTFDDFRYALLLLLPTAFLALLQPAILVVAVPQVAINLLSDGPTTSQPMSHYIAAIVPAVVVASIMAVGRAPERLRVVLAGAPLALSLVILISYPPKPGAHGFIFPEPPTAARRAAMQEALDLVPSDAPVTATNRLGAHLSARHVIHLFPNHRGAEWAVIDARDVWPQPTGTAADGRLFRARLARFARDPMWHLIFETAGVRVYRRVTTP
jgi:uncharacterized membrane protein